MYILEQAQGNMEFVQEIIERLQEIVNNYEEEMSVDE